MNAEPIADFPFKLKWLGDQVKLRLIRRASKKSGEILRDEMSRLAPRRTGLTRDEMGIATKKETPASIEMAIGPSRKAWYARFVEFGTKAHLIHARMKKALKAGNTTSKNAATFSDVTVGGAFFGKTVQHPGIRATPFLGPAVENKGTEAATVYWEVFKEFVDKAFSRSMKSLEK